MSSFPDSCRPPLLRRRRTAGAEPLSVEQRDDIGMAKQTVSVLFSVLPSMIQSRLPEMLSRPSTPTSAVDGNQCWPRVPSASSGTTTPFTEADTLMDDEDGTRFPVARADMAPSDATAVSPTQHQHSGSLSGVNWKCARPGLELLISAVEESKTSRSMSVTPHDPELERRAYLDGVGYLLRGLPQDLDNTELSALRKALPPCISDSVHPQAGSQLVLLPYRRQVGDLDAAPTSMLQRTTRTVVARGIILCLVLWPYVLLLLRWMAAYERKHRISDQVVAHGRALAAAAGRWSVGVSEAIAARGDGRVGQVLAETVAWTVHDMVAGVADGVQDGLARVER